MKMICFIIAISLFVACNTKVKDTEKDTAQQANTATPPPINCYAYTSPNDTITLKVIHVGSTITGTLVYHFKEKDKNMGTIQGAIKNNTLIADYTFMSEGITSVRQVAFKLQNNVFIEGYGEMVNQDNKSIFKNLDALNFDSSMQLTEIACQ